jgi:serine/threonine-protein kinase RsbW
MAIRVLSNNNGIKIILPASLYNIDRAAEEIKKYLEDTDMSRRTFNIVLGIREALLNAVKHGSLDDEKKNVICELRKDRKGLTIRVEDEGEGFEWKKYLLKKISSKEHSGRGIAIMKECFKTVEYSKKGNRLTLKIDPQ